MADATLIVDQQVHPEGEDLGAFPVEQWPLPYTPEGAPGGPAPKIPDPDQVFRYFSFTVLKGAGDVPPGDITPGENGEILKTVGGETVWAANS